MGGEDTGTREARESDVDERANVRDRNCQLEGGFVRLGAVGKEERRGIFGDGEGEERLRERG
jgi:hypothetical protein